MLRIPFAQFRGQRGRQQGGNRSPTPYKCIRDSRSFVMLTGVEESSYCLKVEE